jgi:hypothetical protein
VLSGNQLIKYGTGQSATVSASNGHPVLKADFSVGFVTTNDEQRTLCVLPTLQHTVSEEHHKQTMYFLGESNNELLKLKTWVATVSGMLGGDRSVSTGQLPILGSTNKVTKLVKVDFGFRRFFPELLKLRSGHFYTASDTDRFVVFRRFLENSQRFLGNYKLTASAVTFRASQVVIHAMTRSLESVIYADWVQFSPTQLFEDHKIRGVLKTIALGSPTTIFRIHSFLDERFKLLTDQYLVQTGTTYFTTREDVTAINCQHGLLGSSHGRVCGLQASRSRDYGCAAKIVHSIGPENCATKVPKESVQLYNQVACHPDQTARRKAGAETKKKILLATQPGRMTVICSGKPTRTIAFNSGNTELSDNFTHCHLSFNGKYLDKWTGLDSPIQSILPLSASTGVSVATQSLTTMLGDSRDNTLFYALVGVSAALVLLVCGCCVCCCRCIREAVIKNILCCLVRGGATKWADRWCGQCINPILPPTSAPREEYKLVGKPAPPIVRHPSAPVIEHQKEAVPFTYDLYPPPYRGQHRAQTADIVQNVLENVLQNVVARK